MDKRLAPEAFDALKVGDRVAFVESAPYYYPMPTIATVVRRTKAMVEVEVPESVPVRRVRVSRNGRGVHLVELTAELEGRLARKRAEGVATRLGYHLGDSGKVKAMSEEDLAEVRKLAERFGLV